MNPPKIKLTLNESQTKLYASYEVEESEKPSIVNAVFLMQKMEEKSLDNLHCIEDGFAEIINLFKAKKTSKGKVCIAIKKDGSASLQISKDKMSVYLTIHKAEGGNPATLAMVKQQLSDKGIRHGFLPKAIKQAILSGEADETLIAQGKPVINGENAIFTCLIDNIENRTPKVSEDGLVDYRNLGEILVVHPGDELMRRTPATQGQTSKNVLGEMIKPKIGTDSKFPSSLEGAKTSPKDYNTLIATVTGQPVICKNGVNVEKTMTVDNVDLKSGNIIFDGSIIVTGDVSSGMQVKASGDIKIKGMIENASIEAGGNVSISGAMVGRPDKNSPATDDLVTIKAKGSVSVKFVENGQITSGNKIMIRDWSIKSTLHAVNEIIIGKKDAKKGQIIGGSVTSGILIKAKSIGSNAGAVTHIQVGNSHDIDQEKDKIGILISKQTNELFDLQKTFKDLKSNPTAQAKDMLIKANESKEKCEKELLKLRGLEAALQQEQKRAENAKVIVETMIYAGASVNISKYSVDIQNDLGGRTFAIKGDNIIQGSN